MITMDGPEESNHRYNAQSGQESNGHCCKLIRVEVFSRHRRHTVHNKEFNEGDDRALMRGISDKGERNQFANILLLAIKLIGLSEFHF